MKIALSMIVKDDSEKEILVRCFNSIAPYVDKIFVTTTNKPDGQIVKIVKNYGGETSFYKWDLSFERARNFALKQIPKDYDYIVWCDTDDVWLNAKEIPMIVQEMERQGLTAVYFDYNYDIDPKTNKINIVHPRERIVKNGYYEWKGHLHETLIPIREQNNAFFKNIKVNHFPKENANERNMVRNTEILEKVYKEEGANHDPRTEYYLARQYFDLEKYKEADKLFDDYLKHSGWDEERGLARNYKGLIKLYNKDYDGAIDDLLKATKEFPRISTFYINLAYIYALLEKYDDAIHYANIFIKMPVHKSGIVRVPLDDEIHYYETIYMIAMGKKKVDEALEAAQALADRVPESKEYQEKLEGVKRLNAMIEATKAVETLQKELEFTKEPNKMSVILNGLPRSIEGNAYIEQLRQKYTEPKKWKGIVYYAGKSFEEWTPESLKKGLGGSETAIIKLTEEWKKDGNVCVIGNPGAIEGDYNGVEYQNYFRLNRKDVFDNLIIWRAPWELDYKWKANKIFLDLHDIPNPMEFTKERIDAVTKIMVKSKYHRNLIPHVPDEKIAIIPNGVDENFIKLNTGKHEKYKIIYASSYDRGLYWMLHWGWPIIKKELPEAELHIYYGWNLFDAVHRNNPERMAWKAEMVHMMSQKGVFEHGRVGQEELVKAKASSTIHYFASDFEEIDCISVRESALVGCVPVTTDYAALREKPYGVKVKGDPRLRETQEAAAKEIVRLIKTGEVEKYRDLCIEGAKKETWKEIAKKWQKVMSE